ncbi:hypothetical protein [Pelagibacterium sp.]|uniref:hypothetical protein n=1 Tax=Pelagibacterium sp. TaxID=1967288 RepID=UPI003BAA5217
MKTIDFNAEASLYLGRDWRTALEQGSRRFPSAAKAIRFALEEVPPVSLHGARMIVAGRSYSSRDLQKLYSDKAYPLNRKAEREAMLAEPFNV